MDLKNIRKSIDTIDSEIVRLLNRRAENALRLKRLKAAVAMPDREREVIDRVRGFSRHVVEPDFVERLYRLIMEESRRIQERGLRLAGFQGEHGAYSEVAASACLAQTVPIPFPTFQEVFDEVSSGQLDYGVVPVENSLEGPVAEVNDLLAETGLHVVAEVRVPVHHCLLALPEQDCRDLRVVYSHPQALGQCSRFIARHRLEARPFYDTAGAAAMLREKRPEASAVIAGRQCAELYGLAVLQEDIENHASNTTRYLVLAGEPAAGGGDKCSVVFSVAHRPGGLFAALRALADARLNMTRIESRPLRGDPGSFAFFLDFEGSDRDEGVRRALDDLAALAGSFRLLGCYPAARP